MMNVIRDIAGLEVGAIAPNSIVNADCLEAMKLIPDKSIDCVIADLPYGVTNCAWDLVIPFDLLWEQYKRIIKPNGAICLFGSQPFTSALVMSNPKWFKYEWIWEKTMPTGFFNAKRQPMKAHENILVFGDGATKYTPQKTKALTLRSSNTSKKVAAKSIYGITNRTEWHEDGTRYPISRINFSNWNGNLFGKIENKSKHNNAKPVPLIEYLIKTYSQEDELILDNTSGSGTLAIACINTNRNYICIEKDLHYFQVSCDRVANHDPLAPIKAKKPKAAPKGQLSFFDIASQQTMPSIAQVN